MRSSLASAACSRAPLRRLRNGALAAITGGALLLAAAPAAAEAKVAVIDVNRAVLETEQGLRVQATLNKLVDSRQADLLNKQQQLQADKEALDKEAQAGKTPKEQLQKRYENLQRLAVELQSRMNDAQREMQRKEEELKTPILQGLLDAVKRIAAQDGFDMVLEKSAVPHFRGELDITDRAIRLYNGGQAGGAAPATPPGKGAPAAPAAPPAKTPAPAAPAPKK